MCLNKNFYALLKEVLIVHRKSYKLDWRHMGARIMIPGNIIEIDTRVPPRASF